MSDFLTAEAALELSISLLKRFETRLENSQANLIVHCLRMLHRQELAETQSQQIQDFVSLAMSVWTKVVSDTASSHERLLAHTIESVVAQVLHIVESGYIGILFVPAKATVQKCLTSKRYKLPPDRDRCLLSTLLTLDEAAFRTEFLSAHNSLVGKEWYNALIVEGKLDQVLGAFAEASYLIPDSLLELIDTRCSRMACELRKGDIQSNGFIPLLVKFKRFLAETTLPLEGANALMQEFMAKSETEEFDAAIELAGILWSKAIPINSERNAPAPRRLGLLLLKVLCSTLRVRLRHITKQQVVNASVSYAECSFAARHLRETFLQCKHFVDDELEDATYIIDVMKSCLRFAVNVCSDSFEKLRIELLDLIYEVLVAFKCRMNFGRTDKNSVSSVVFDLVSNHSQFISVCQAHEQPQFQSAIFSILQLCLVMNSSISFEPYTWKTLSRAFSASPSQKDRLVFGVIETYAKRANNVSTDFILHATDAH
jgi:hypothetical protein